VFSKPKYETDIRLGERYRDDQTGIEGVATSVHFYQHGCERVTVELVMRDGELKEYTFDAPRLTHIATGVTAVTTRTGGPRPDPSRPSTGAR
jgi:hypothetical protein